MEKIISQVIKVNNTLNINNPIILLEDYPIYKLKNSLDILDIAILNYTIFKIIDNLVLNYFEKGVNISYLMSNFRRDIKEQTAFRFEESAPENILQKISVIIENFLNGSDISKENAYLSTKETLKTIKPCL